MAKQLQHTNLAFPESQKQRVARLVDSHLRHHYSLMMKKLGLKKLAVPYQQNNKTASAVVRESLNQDSSDEEDHDPLMQTVVRVHM